MTDSAPSAARDFSKIWELLANAFRSPSVTDACIGPNGCFIDDGDGIQPFLEGRLPENLLRDWVVYQLSLQSRSFDARQPFADFVIPGNGEGDRWRVHALFPPLCPEGTQLSLRRLAGRRLADNTPHSQTSRWSETSGPAIELLQEATRKKETILIAGATSSGKTTLLNDLLGIIPPNERLIALEDTPELQPLHPQFIRLVSRPPTADGIGEVSLKTLFRQTLRMRPDRILIGECRGPEILEWLQALQTGHAGSLATIHASSPRDALRRAELLALLSGVPHLTSQIVRDLLAGGITWIAFVERLAQGRTITEISRVRGREGDTILLEPVINPRREDRHGRLETFRSFGSSLQKSSPRGGS